MIVADVQDAHRGTLGQGHGATQGGHPLVLQSIVAQIQIELNPGDLVVLYTDGITEAMNDKRELYGLQRLCNAVVKHHHLSADEVKTSVIADLRRYIGNQTIFDDITLLVIKQK